MLSVPEILQFVGAAAGFYALGFGVGKAAAWIRAIRDVV